MDFQFFAHLSESDANAYLSNFVTVESRACLEMIDRASDEGKEFTFSMASLSAFMEWAYLQMRSVAKSADNSVPAWIRDTDTYQRGLFEFDEKSKIMILRCAYFWGACFINDHPRLSWGIGDRDTALQNMPVVLGFRGKLEMPPLLICENLFRRAERQRSVSVFAETIDVWKRSI